ncbi:hypothetical protein TanjilG_10612 [Lupinus angustifolius]|uniref:Uncharacterized protein n=1 Tax=Lupinus angustifolius TaxID=3871 RepID=A0A4P1RW01_LUPAN|nr:hypothetical protein TanjilG_10612 [Lupinus angustifolius]
MVTLVDELMVVMNPSLSMLSKPAIHHRKIINKVAAFLPPLTLLIAINSHMTLSTPEIATSSAKISNPPFRHIVTSVTTALSLALSEPSLNTQPNFFIPTKAVATATNPPRLTTASSIIIVSYGSTAMASTAISTAPPSTKLATVSLSPAKFNITTNASLLAPSGPQLASWINPLMTRFIFPSLLLYATIPVKLNIVAAAFAFASHVAPDPSTSTTPFNAPSVTIIILLLNSYIDKLRIVVMALT